MRCSNCEYYVSNPSFNMCKLVGFECFHVLEDCKLINDDGTVNKEELSKDCY